MKRLTLILCLCMPCPGASEGTWLVKPEGAEVRTWTYTVGADSPSRTTPGLDWNDLTVYGLTFVDGALYLVAGDGGRAMLISHKTGRLLRAWAPAGLNPRSYYRGSVFHGTWSGVAEWSISKRKVVREWEMDAPGATPERLGDQLLVPLVLEDRVQFVSIDLNSGLIAWRTSIDRPVSAGEPGRTGVLLMGYSSPVSHWQLPSWGGTYCAVDVESGDVLSVDVGMPPDLFAYPAYGVHVDRGSGAMTVLREQEIIQKAHGSGEVLWRGEFSEGLRPLGMSTAKDGRVFVEFEVLLKDPTTSAEAVGSYLHRQAAGVERYPVRAPVSEFPLRGVAAIDLHSGSVPWLSTIAAGDLGLDPAQVRTAALNKEFLGERGQILADFLPRAGPLAVANLVVMRPITFYGPTPTVSHYLVGLDADTGSVAFIYAPTPAVEWYGEEHIDGLLTADSVVCFSTNAGRVYGLDLSGLVGRSEE